MERDLDILKKELKKVEKKQLSRHNQIKSVQNDGASEILVENALREAHIEREKQNQINVHALKEAVKRNNLTIEKSS